MSDLPDKAIINKFLTPIALVDNDFLNLIIPPKFY